MTFLRTSSHTTLTLSQASVERTFDQSILLQPQKSEPYKSDREKVRWDLRLLAKESGGKNVMFRHTGFSVQHCSPHRCIISNMLQIIGWWDSSLRLKMSCWGKDKIIGGWGNWGALWRRIKKIKCITLRGGHYETGIRADMLLSLTHKKVQVSNVLKCIGRTLVWMCNKQKM